MLVLSRLELLVLVALVPSGSVSQALHERLDELQTVRLVQPPRKVTTVANEKEQSVVLLLLLLAQLSMVIYQQKELLLLMVVLLLLLLVNLDEDSVEEVVLSKRLETTEQHPNKNTHCVRNENLSFICLFLYTCCCCC